MGYETCDALSAIQGGQQVVPLEANSTWQAYIVAAPRTQGIDWRQRSALRDGLGWRNPLAATHDGTLRLPVAAEYDLADVTQAS